MRAVQNACNATFSTGRQIASASGSGEGSHEHLRVAYRQIQLGHLGADEGRFDTYAHICTKRTQRDCDSIYVIRRHRTCNAMQVFLKRGVPLHMPNKMGALGLHCAASMGHVDVVNNLLAKGTHVDTKTKA
jgi:hypothetical protein